MDSNSSVVCSQQEKGCAAHADAKVLNALALETNEDSSVTTEHGDRPVGNSGSSLQVLQIRKLPSPSPEVF